MERIETDHAGVVVYRDVPVVDGGEHRAYAYLHFRGLSRDLPSTLVRVFVLVSDTPEVTAVSGPEHPGFLGEAAVYNSPPGPGAPQPAAPGRPTPRDQGPYDLLLDVSDGIRRISPGSTVDLVLAVRAAAGQTLDTSRFRVDDLEITRRS